MNTSLLQNISDFVKSRGDYPHLQKLLSRGYLALQQNLPMPVELRSVMNLPETYPTIEVKGALKFPRVNMFDTADQRLAGICAVQAPWCFADFKKKFLMSRELKGDTYEAQMKIGSAMPLTITQSRSKLDTLTFTLGDKSESIPVTAQDADAMPLLRNLYQSLDVDVLDTTSPVRLIPMKSIMRMFEGSEVTYRPGLHNQTQLSLTVAGKDLSVNEAIEAMLRKSDTLLADIPSKQDIGNIKWVTNPGQYPVDAMLMGSAPTKLVELESMADTDHSVAYGLSTLHPVKWALAETDTSLVLCELDTGKIMDADVLEEQFDITRSLTQTQQQEEGYDLF